MREEAKLADGDNIFLTMPTTGFNCAERTIKTESTTMLLVKHNSPRYPAKVFWTDIADSIDGGGEEPPKSRRRPRCWGAGRMAGRLVRRLIRRMKCIRRTSIRAASIRLMSLSRL
jgi:hypothetical protein